MKSTEKHTIWLAKPEGSEMKISMENYTPEIREQIISDYEASGWMVLYQQTKKRPEWLKTYDWAISYGIGFVFGVVVTMVVVWST